jgi:hypothetical protein
MQRLLAQALALLAMAASAVNAQCAVSCSLHPAGARVSRAEHSCCPRQSGSKPSQRKEETPCGHSVLPSDAARLERGTTPNFFFAPLSIAVCLTGGFLLSQTAAPVFIATPNLSGLPLPASITVLRV